MPYLILCLISALLAGGGVGLLGVRPIQLFGGFSCGDCFF